MSTFLAFCLLPSGFTNAELHDELAPPPLAATAGSTT